MKPLRERIADAFSTEGQTNDSTVQEKLTNFLGAIRETQRDYSEGIRRSVLLLLLLMAVFELLSSTAVSEFTLGPIRMTTASSIQVYIPTLVAYLNLETFMLALRASNLTRAYEEAFRVWHPPAAANQLHSLLQPRGSLYFAPTLTDPTEFSSPPEKLEFRVSFVLSVIVLFIPILFEVHAFVRLFDRFHISSILVWLNLLLSLTFVALTIGAWLAADRSG